MLLLILADQMAVLCVQILRKPDGTSRGFGFVTYRDESMVEKCLVVTHTINGKTVRPATIPAYAWFTGWFCESPYCVPWQVDVRIRMVFSQDCSSITLDAAVQVEVKRAVKKEDMAAGAGYDQSYAARTGKAPDWHCPDCRNKNFGWREVCNRCQVCAAAVRLCNTAVAEQPAVLVQSWQVSS